MLKQLSIIVLVFCSLCVGIAFDEALERFLPDNDIPVIKHTYFNLQFNVETKTAYWVMYRITVDNLVEAGKRDDMRFVPDPAIPESVKSSNYNKSGYDRGHLCPAEDMEFSIEAMRETFCTSNIAPQNPSCNRGIWKELENRVRKMVMQGRELLIITGPIYKDSQESIGKDEVRVPDAFFKIIYDYRNDMAIGFIIPNQPLNDASLETFARSVAEIEKEIGIDFPISSENVEIKAAGF